MTVTYCLAPNGSSLKVCVHPRVLIIAVVMKLAVGGIVVPAELQVGEFAGGVRNGMVGLGFNDCIIGGSNQRFQIVGDFICHSICIDTGGSIGIVKIKGSTTGRTGLGLGQVSGLDPLQGVLIRH